MGISEPSKITVPFAESGLKNPIPANSDNTTGKAGFDKGFPERTMLPKASGGIPPSGMDFNGILYDITSAIRYMQAGGVPTYDSAFSAAIGGYPSGAVLIGNDGVSVFQNAVDGNETDPNSGGAGWTRPDLQVMELYRRSYAEAGYNVVGTFRAGFTIVNANDVGIDEASGKAFSGPAGTVAAGTDPTSGGFVDRSPITLSSKMIALELNGCVPDFDFSTNTGTDNYAAIAECLSRAKALGWSVTSLSGGAFGFSGHLNIDVELDLNGAALCQLNRASDSVTLKKGGQLNNGSLFHNMSTGTAFSVDGASEIFIGRQHSNVCDNLRIYSSDTVQPVSNWVGTGIHLKADTGQYVSGSSIRATVQGFADGYKETTTGTGFINSLNVNLNMNLCKRFVTIDAEVPVKGYTIGESRYNLNIQPQSGAEYAMSLACENSEFVGNIWDAAQFSDVTKVVRLINKTPPPPNQGFTTSRGNKISMFGVNSDRVFGALMSNTVTNPTGNNPSKVTQPFQRQFGSNLFLRKVKDGANGVTDSLSFLQVVDNAIAGADVRFLVLTTRTNAAGANLGGLAPSGGTIHGMFVGNSTNATFTTSDFATVTVSIKEGAYPKSQMNVDAVGVKLLGNATDIIVEVRQTGTAQWVLAYEGFNVDRDFIAVRCSPFGGSTNVVSTVAIDGIRVRVRSAGGVVAIENIFCMSPDENGKDFVDANDAMVLKGNLVFPTSTQGPQVVDTVTGQKYRIAVVNGSVVATLLI